MQRTSTPDAARLPARPSTRKASRRAIATWCATACSQGYILGSYSARKLGLKTTGNAGGIHNLQVGSRHRAQGFDELLAAMDIGPLWSRN